MQVIVHIIGFQKFVGLLLFSVLPFYEFEFGTLRYLGGSGNDKNDKNVMHATEQNIDNAKTDINNNNGNNNAGDECVYHTDIGKNLVCRPLSPFHK